MPTSLQFLSRRCSSVRRARLAGLARLAASLGALAIAHPSLAHVERHRWETHGPTGAGVTALAVDPRASHAVYAATAGHGVFKSVDAGATWRGATNGLGAIYVESLAVHPTLSSTLYAASPSHGLFKSTDSGANWIAAGDGLPSPTAHLLAVGPAGLYVSLNEGVFKSFYGDFWTPTDLRTETDDASGADPSFSAWIDCLAVEPGSGAIYACYFTWADQPGPGWELLRSANMGATWQSVPLPTTGGPVAIAFDGDEAASMYVATYEPVDGASQILRSTDGGQTWDAVGSGLPGCESGCRVHALALDGAEPCTVYAGTDRGVYAAREGGGWLALSDGLDDRMVTSLAVDPSDPSLIYAGTSDGVFTMHNPPSCGSDCNGDGVVGIAELIIIVDIALGGTPMPMCPAADAAGDGAMRIDDLVGAVRHALGGC